MPCVLVQVIDNVLVPKWLGTEHPLRTFISDLPFIGDLLQEGDMLQVIWLGLACL